MAAAVEVQLKGHATRDGDNDVNGQKLEGALIRKDDFIVTLTLADGTRKTIARDGDVPKGQVRDPNEAHKKLVPTLDNKDMHDVTALSGDG